MSSAIYQGRVTHVRLKPRRHRLAYRLFQMLIDLDELPDLARRLRLFGHNGPGLLSFHDADHGPGEARPLRAWVEARLAEAGIDPGGGAIRLLCLPRVLGRGFNPLSLYFCHEPSGALAAILYEVNNTFGERHSYLLPVDPAQQARVRQGVDKRFFVSPFMDMDLHYEFDVRPPGEGVLVSVTARDGEGPVLLASFAGRRTGLSDAAILSAVLRHPLLAATVLLPIHWEAVKIWLRGLRLRPRPPAPAQAVTVARGPAGARRAA